MLTQFSHELASDYKKIQLVRSYLATDLGIIRFRSLFCILDASILAYPFVFEGEFEFLYTDCVSIF